MTKNFAEKIIQQAKAKKDKKILKGFYLNPNLISSFEKSCNAKNLKYSRVVEELISSFLSAESK